MNKVAWKRCRLTHAVSCQEEASQLVVFSKLKGKFPGLAKYMEMFPCLAVLGKNTLLRRKKKHTAQIKRVYNETPRKHLQHKQDQTQGGICHLCENSTAKGDARDKFGELCLPVFH